jgi:K+-transporting ATPase ATPase C chain
MLSAFRISAVLLLLLSLVTGIAYPLAVSAVGAVLFPRQATGSLIDRDGKPIGSDLIGQPFDEAKYFWGRPSATAPVGYAAMSGSGSNQATTNPALVEAVQGRVAHLKEADPENTAPIPVDLVTTSGSGLDPHVSPAAALYQVDRVARARGVPAEKIRALVQTHVEAPTFHILGQSRVNVLRLNLALDAEFPAPKS